MVLSVTAKKESISREAHWNFDVSRRIPDSLDEFLDAKKDARFKFFEGKEPWLDGLQKLSWQTFFRVCTEEMDDLSGCVKLVASEPGCLGH
jgi:hypothetical protein